MLDSLVPQGSYVRTPDVAYGALPRQRLDVYRPREVRRDARIVVFFYGGYWQSGRKEDYRFVAEALTSRGLIAVMPDYRLYPEVTFPGFVEDGALAVKWVHDHAAEIGGDAGRVYLMGHSAGGHIAALLTLDEHYLREVGLDRSAYSRDGWAVWGRMILCPIHRPVGFLEYIRMSGLSRFILWTGMSRRCCW